MVAGAGKKNLESISLMEDDLLVLEEKPAGPSYMIAGFEQWANAGNVSSGLPEYLVQKLGARKIGHIEDDGFYLFQFPGTHFMLRPAVKYAEGSEEYYQERKRNDFHYAEIGGKGLVIFIGTEPHMREDIYANTLLDSARELEVEKIITPAGVAGEVPFEKERDISCIYSQPKMRGELESLAVRFSNYDKTATISMVINHYARKRGMEFARMCATTPAYRISARGSGEPFTVEKDYKAMFDVLNRVRYMFEINLDLSDLKRESDKLISDLDSQLKDLSARDSRVSQYLERIRDNFEELNFEEYRRFKGKLGREIEEIIEREEGL